MPVTPPQQELIALGELIEQSGPAGSDGPPGPYSDDTIDSLEMPGTTARRIR